VRRSSAAILFAASAFGSIASAVAAPPHAALLPQESRIGFITQQMGVPVEGQFRKFDAQIALDPKRPDGGSVAMQIDTGSATLGAAQADAELPTAAWFDTVRHPRASFQSESIRQLGGGKLEVVGTLTIKGRARPLMVPVTIAPGDGAKSVASGSFTVQRLEFRIGEGEWSDISMVADAVQVRFRLTFTGLAGMAAP